MRKTIYSKESKTLTKWLRTQRVNSGLTQRQFAAMLDVHHSIVGKIETGEHRIDVIELIEYCHVLAADPHEAINKLLSIAK